MRRTAAERMCAQTFFLAAFLFVLLAYNVSYADTCASVQTDNSSYFNFPNDAAYGAASFTPAADCAVSAIGFHFYDSGGTVHVKVYDDVAARPGFVVATGSDVPGNSDFATSTFDGTVTLVGGTTYWLVFSSASGATGVTWGFDTGSYVSSANGSSWSGVNTGSPSFTVDASGGGGGGGDTASTTVDEIVGASFVLWTAVASFIIGLVGTVWIYFLVV